MCAAYVCYDLGMISKLKRQKIYIYVDESGQDDTSKFFIVVSAVSVRDHDLLRQELLKIEAAAGTHALKWNKSRHDRRMKYISLALERKIAAGHVFVGRYHKPVPYFYPVASVIERAVKYIVRDMGGKYLAMVHVDGANRTVAKALTNALRANGISLRMVRGKTDQGEIIIRFADMWAGCIRDALLNEQDSKILFERALRSGYLVEVTT